MMKLNVVHLLMMANEKINGLQYCACSHLDCMCGYVEQTLDIDKDENHQIYDILKTYPIHKLYNIDSQNHTEEEADLYRKLHAANVDLMEYIHSHRIRYQPIQDYIEKIEKQFGIDQDEDRGEMFIVSVLLSEEEHGWWKVIDQELKSGAINEYNAAEKRAMILSRGMCTLKTDLFTIRVDDAAGALFLDSIDNQDTERIRKIRERDGMWPNILLDQAIGRTGVVDMAVNIRPQSTGLFHPYDIYEVFVVNRNRFSLSGFHWDPDDTEDNLSKKVIPEIREIAAIEHDEFNWDYWEKMAWNACTTDNKIFFRVGYRLQFLFDCYMLQSDYDNCENKHDYPAILSDDDEENGSPSINTYHNGAGHHIVLLTPRYYNNVYHVHCEMCAVEYDDFWPHTIDEDEEED